LVVGDQLPSLIARRVWPPKGQEFDRADASIRAYGHHRQSRSRPSWPLAI